jgi:hypothetical protein
MVHWLTLGHLDPEAVRQLRAVVLRPLDMNLVMCLLRELGTVDKKGNAWLGAFPVRFEQGYISCGWLGAVRNRVAEDFARRLQGETGCLVADIQHGEIIDIERTVKSRSPL